MTYNVFGGTLNPAQSINCIRQVVPTAQVWASHTGLFLFLYVWVNSFYPWRHFFHSKGVNCISCLLNVGLMIVMLYHVLQWAASVNQQQPMRTFMRAWTSCVSAWLEPLSTRVSMTHSDGQSLCLSSRLRLSDPHLTMYSHSLFWLKTRDVHR